MEEKIKKDRKYVNMVDLFPENEAAETTPPIEGFDPLIDLPRCYNGIGEIDLAAM